MSAAALEDIYLASYSPTDLDAETLKVARSMDPVLLPLLDDMHDNLWSALWDSDVTEYSGDLLPSFIGDGAPVSVVRKEGWWAIQPDDLEENTIYVVNGGAQFSGGVDIENVAIIANGQIGVGGGFDLVFDNVFFMGTQLNLAGNITWGETADACDDDTYGVYLFGTQSLSMGGWGEAVAINGVVGAAPTFNPGGAMQGSGVYFESDSHLDLGGNIEISGCGTARSSEYTLADLTEAQSASTSGSYFGRLNYRGSNLI